MATEALKENANQDTVPAMATTARANFVLARVEAITGHPEESIADFQTTLKTSKEPRLIAWSHIYLGRMLDLNCKRDEALAEYKLAMENRDGQQDTRIAAERGVKAAYAVNGHSCEDDADEAEQPTSGAKPGESAKPNSTGGSGGNPFPEPDNGAPQSK
jgi:hypothetical protein